MAKKDEETVKLTDAEGKGRDKKGRGAKVFKLQVRRNDSDWADVAQSTVATHDDNRDLQQVPMGLTPSQADMVAEDWIRAGYEVQLVELEEPEPQPEPEPEPEPEQLPAT
jgi:hypothetical protein